MEIQLENESSTVEETAPSLETELSQKAVVSNSLTSTDHKPPLNSDVAANLRKEKMEIAAPTAVDADVGNLLNVNRTFKGGEESIPTDGTNNIVDASSNSMLTESALHDKGDTEIESDNAGVDRGASLQISRSSTPDGMFLGDPGSPSDSRNISTSSASTVVARGERLTYPVRNRAGPLLPAGGPPVQLLPSPALNEFVADPVPNDVPKRETEEEGRVLGGFVSHRENSVLYVHPHSDLVLLDFVQHCLARDLYLTARNPTHKVLRVVHENKAYRCHIVEETGDLASVRLIDYGNLVHTKKPKCFLPLEALTIPPLTVRVVVKDLPADVSNGTFVNLRLTSMDDNGSWNGLLL